MVPLMVALSITRDHGWTSPEVLGLLALAAVILAIFFVIETRTDHPIVPFALFKNSTFSVSMIVASSPVSVCSARSSSSTHLPGVLGVSATDSGQLSDVSNWPESVALTPRTPLVDEWDEDDRAEHTETGEEANDHGDTEGGVLKSAKGTIGWSVASRSRRRWPG